MHPLTRACDCTSRRKTFIAEVQGYFPAAHQGHQFKPWKFIGFYLEDGPTIKEAKGMRCKYCYKGSSVV